MNASTLPRLALLLLLLATPAPPNLTALWDSSTSATLSWFQDARGCLYRQPANGAALLIVCYDRYPATIVVELGHAGPSDAAYHPASGDVYAIVFDDGRTETAPLVARPVYLGAIRR